MSSEVIDRASDLRAEREEIERNMYAETLRLQMIRAELAQLDRQD